MRVSEAERLPARRSAGRRGWEADDAEGEDVERAGEREDDAVAEARVQERADDLPEDDAAHGAAEADEAGDGADRPAREQIGGQDHHQRRPGLLAEVGEAENRQGPRHGRIGHEQHRRHHRGAQPQRDLARPVERQLLREQPAR